MKDPTFVYIIMLPPDPYASEVHACATSYDLAEKIAKEDEASGLIVEGWTIQEMFLHTSEGDV